MKKYLLIFILGYVGFSSTAFESQNKTKKSLTKGPKDIWVMVVDTGVGYNSLLKDHVQYSSSLDYRDDSGHGTHVAGIVARGNDKLNDPLCSNVKIFSCSYWSHPYQNELTEENTINCFKKASELHMDYINYSSGGSSPSFEEYAALKKFEEQGGITVAAAGNDGKPADDYYPAAYRIGFKFLSPDGKFRRAPPLKSVYIVEAKCGDKLCPYSNYHYLAYTENGEDVYSTGPNDTFFKLHGTSQAAPELLHKILKTRCDDIQKGVIQLKN